MSAMRSINKDFIIDNVWAPTKMEKNSRHDLTNCLGSYTGAGRKTPGVTLTASISSSVK